MLQPPPTYETRSSYEDLESYPRYVLYTREVVTDASQNVVACDRVNASLCYSKLFIKVPGFLEFLARYFALQKSQKGKLTVSNLRKEQ